MDATHSHREEPEDMSQYFKCAASQGEKARAEESDMDKVTEALNEVYTHECSSLDSVVAQMQWLSLPKEDW